VLDLAWAWREQVTSDLAGAVFQDVFPALPDALSAADPQSRPTDPAWPNAVRHAALILLYRRLFLLYAEDRDLQQIYASIECGPHIDRYLDFRRYGFFGHIQSWVAAQRPSTVADCCINSMKSHRSLR